MIGLYLLAAHLAGDFLLQDRWRAVLKLTSARRRAEHVAVYCLPFVPIAALTARDPRVSSAPAFVASLAVLHFLVDARRIFSTPGDVIQWRLDLRHDPVAAKRIWLQHVVEATPTSIRAVDVSDESVRWPPPNPWPPTALMIDQSLHVVSIAVLAGLFLR